MRFNLPPFCLLLGLLVIGSSCSENTLPVAPFAPRQPAFLIVPPSVSNLDFPVRSSTDPSNSLALPTYADSLIAEFQLVGTIAVQSSPLTQVQGYSGPLDGSGIYVESVFSACYVNVTFHYSGVAGNPGPVPCYLTPNPQTSWKDTVLVAGTGTVTRGPGVPQFNTWDCGTQPCHSYSGTQAVSVTPLSATLTLTASTSDIVGPQFVIFTGGTNPLSIAGINVPFKVKSWRWLPAGGGTGQTVACNPGVNPCSPTVQESGAMELTALVNGAEKIDTVSVTIDHVQLTPQLTRMPPSIQTAARQQPSSQTILVSVVGSSGPLPNRDVLVGLAATDNTGGHFHTGGKPAGSLDKTQINTGASGVATVTFTAPDPSGLVEILASSGSATGVINIDVGIFTLVELGPGSNYSLTGDFPIHPKNHWGTQAHLAQLMILAQRFYSKFGTTLTFNDTSLPFGGLYDVGTTYWATPHLSHREGKDTDMQTNGLTTAQLSYVDENWPKISGIDVYNETATTHPCYHLSSKN